ncbi:MAG: signal peptidase I [Oscillospiraceae bacterium]|jgi:signal peptidase I|nr:signal peptidase I [Oscillospiraceae bacterium]
MSNELLKPGKPNGLSLFAFNVADVICTAFVILLLVFTFGLRTSWVIGPSMNPTLHNGQFLVITAAPRQLRYGDIVVVSETGTNLPERQPIVKRVIGLPGDVMSFDFEKGIVYRNGEALREPYIAEPTYLHNYWGGETPLPCTVPAGRCFIMGDNRNDSTDSRSAMVGLVDVRDVVGVKMGK